MYIPQLSVNEGEGRFKANDNIKYFIYISIISWHSNYYLYFIQSYFELQPILVVSTSLLPLHGKIITLA